MDPAAPGAAEAPQAAPASEPAAAPVAPQAAPPAAPTTEEQTQTTEDQEWDNATDEIFPGIKAAKNKKEDGKPDESAEPAKEPKATETPEDPEAKAPDGTEPGTEANPTDEENEEEPEQADPSRYAARREARERQQEVEALKADVRKQMFADAPTELRDADGDPIKTIEDVMGLVNPRTGERFTEEEAGMWLLSAQQRFNQQMEDTNAQIENIAVLHQDLHDQVNSINYRYGELLKALPDVRDKLWTEYQRTLVKDEKSGIITKAPVSLEDFYEIALEPYARLAEEELAREAAKPTEPVETPEQKAEREKKEKEEADAKKKKERADRSDIYTGGDKGSEDPDDKEWDEAAKAVFGPRK